MIADPLAWTFSLYLFAQLFVISVLLLIGSAAAVAIRLHPLEKAA